jgi:hypothetical protein
MLSHTIVFYFCDMQVLQRAQIEEIALPAIEYSPRGKSKTSKSSLSSLTVADDDPLEEDTDDIDISWDGMHSQSSSRFAKKSLSRRRQGDDDIDEGEEEEGPNSSDARESSEGSAHFSQSDNRAVKRYV